MPLRTTLVAEKMFGHTHHTLAKQPGVHSRSGCCQLMEPFCKWRRSTISAGRGVIGIKTPEGAQLVLGVAKAVSNVERLRERRAQLGSLGCRRPQRGLQPHLGARLP